MTTSHHSAQHVLLVDDEPAYQRLGSAFLTGLGLRVGVAGDGDSALQTQRRDPAQLVLLDLAMPPSMDPEAGLALIPQFAPALVIVLTGHGDHELALRAHELGAWDLLSKPIDPDMLAIVVKRALSKASLEAELRELRERQRDEDNADDLGMVGQTPAMQQLRNLVRRVAQTQVSAIVLGPTGTGKELVARALHSSGPRRQGPFAVIHCGALSAELLESELFGHLKGSFTGAYRDQAGLVESADGGTLFLDEVGEMPPPMQVKLLRFLQEGSFVPVGGRVGKQADVRVVAATHRDLEAMVRDGSFREDLFYRLKGVVLRTPALAERRGDVPLLATRFLRRIAPGTGFSNEAMAWLSAHDWPGNVRQLRAVVESAGALLLPGEDRVEMELLRFSSGEAAELPASVPAPQAGQGGLLDTALADLELRLIQDAMAAAGGNQSEAARRLGISRVGLIKKLTRMGLR